MPSHETGKGKARSKVGIELFALALPATCEFYLMELALLESTAPRQIISCTSWGLYLFEGWFEGFFWLRSDCLVLHCQTCFEWWALVQAVLLVTVSRPAWSPGQPIHHNWL